MYEFFDRLVAACAAAHPRLPRASRRASSTVAAATRSACRTRPSFPEIELDKIKRQQGMDITIVTTAATNDAGTATC
jgi:ribosomal protein L5